MASLKFDAIDAKISISRPKFYRNSKTAQKMLSNIYNMLSFGKMRLRIMGSRGNNLWAKKGTMKVLPKPWQSTSVYDGVQDTY